MLSPFRTQAIVGLHRFHFFLLSMKYCVQLGNMVRVVSRCLRFETKNSPPLILVTTHSTRIFNIQLSGEETVSCLFQNKLCKSERSRRARILKSTRQVHLLRLYPLHYQHTYFYKNNKKKHHSKFGRLFYNLSSQTETDNHKIKSSILYRHHAATPYTDVIMKTN